MNIHKIKIIFNFLIQTDSEITLQNSTKNEINLKYKKSIIVLEPIIHSKTYGYLPIIFDDPSQEKHRFIEEQICNKYSFILVPFFYSYHIVYRAVFLFFFFHFFYKNYEYRYLFSKIYELASSFIKGKRKRVLHYPVIYIWIHIFPIFDTFSFKIIKVQLCF